LSQIHDEMNVLNCIFSKSIETSFNFACSVTSGASFVAAWKRGEIRSSFSKVKTQSEYRSACFETACLSMADVLLLPLSTFVVMSPIRWSLVHLAFSTAHQYPIEYDAWYFRRQLFSCVSGSLWDIFAYPFGLLTLCSPFGRIVTIWRSTEYYFRPNQNFEEKCDSLDRWSSRLIFQGFGTMMDVVVVVFAAPCILLVPTVWTPTYQGLVELHAPNNLPSELVSTKYYQKAWMEEYYDVLQSHLSNQTVHAVLDVLLLPFYLLVSLSPSRKFELQCTIETVRVERIELQEIMMNGSSPVPLIPYVSDLDYYYSFELRGNVCVLALLAVSDLLMFHSLLPAWLRQYRFTTRKEKEKS